MSFIESRNPTWNVCVCANGATRERDITRTSADGSRRTLFLGGVERDRSDHEGRGADFRPAGFATYDQPVWGAFRGKREKKEKEAKTDVTWTEEEAGRNARVTESSPRFFVVHNRERKRGKRKTRRYSPGRPWYREQRKRTTSTESPARTAGRTSTHPVVSDPRSPTTQDVSCVSHAILRQVSTTSVYDLVHAPSLHVYTGFFLAPTKKTRHGYNGLIFFFIIWDLRVTLVPDWQRQTRIVSLLSEETAEKAIVREGSQERERKVFGGRSFGQACARCVCLYPLGLVGNAFACFRDRRNYSRERKEKDLRAANNVAQLRS